VGTGHICYDTAQQNFAAGYGLKLSENPMYPVKTDSVLLQTFAADGDEHAFSEIVRRYGSFVYATCYRVLQNRAKAEEASQETFLKLLRKPQSVTSSLGGWLYKAASQQAIDASRSETSRRRREATYATTPREVSTWAEISPFIDEAIAELPEETRTLLVMHFLEGRSQTELASEMGLSISTVCRRVKNGLAELREKLKSRDVWVGSLALAEFLVLDSAMQAPATLRWELQKMAMLSGHGHPLSVSAPAVPDPFLIPRLAAQTFCPRVRMFLLITLSAGWLAITAGPGVRAMMHHQPTPPPPIEDRHE
jgi:RNA polymerase sigma-70 factor (ECF subfamily)